MLRSPLYAGRLRDGRPTRFAAPIDGGLIEQAQAYRRARTRIGNRARRNRTYALSGSGPLVCDACGLAVKGDTRGRRNGTKIAVYRHRDGMDCPGWMVHEVPTELLEAQVACLLDGVRPNRETAARIRAALGRTVMMPDRLAIARLDAQLKALAAELVAPNQRRSSGEIVANVERARIEGAALASRPAERDDVDPEQALTGSSVSKRQKRPKGEDWSSLFRPLLRSRWWAILDSNQ